MSLTDTVRDTSTAGQPVARAARMAWVDVAKGIAIILVVLGHAVMGVRDARMLSPDSAWIALRDAIYLFHMPLFFFLSGLFVERRILAGKSAYVAAAFTKIVWPYVLWSTLQLSVMGWLPSVVNTPITFGVQGFLSLPWRPVSQFWFLNTLFLCQMLALAGIVWGARGLLCLGLMLFVLPEFVAPPQVLFLFCQHFVYFALGMVFADVVNRPTSGTWHRPALGLLSGLLFLTLSARMASADVATTRLAVIAPAIAGGVCVLCLARSIGGRIRDVLASLGNQSFGIYILHVFFTAGIRIALVRSGWPVDPGVVIVLAVLGGLLGPIGLVRAFRACGLARPLGLAH